jgi:hypothetical protein
VSIAGGIRRSNNAAGSIRKNGRKCSDFHHFSHEIIPVSTARYAAGVAIVTHYKSRFPAAEFHKSPGSRTYGLIAIPGNLPDRSHP